ncbi:hypothetical protein ACX3P1_14060 [Mesorhizobium sp. A623]
MGTYSERADSESVWTRNLFLLWETNRIAVDAEDVTRSWLGAGDIMIRAMVHAVVGATIAIFSLAATPARADAIEWKQWSYNCMHDHKDPYGTVMNAANCWAIICRGVKSHHFYGLGSSCLYVFKFTREGQELSRMSSDELCQPAPSKAAVDGTRIDSLTDEEQINAVRKGKRILRRVEVRGWPYCEDTDIEADLSGSEHIYQKLLKMSPKYLGDPKP